MCCGTLCTSPITKEPQGFVFPRWSDCENPSVRRTKMPIMSQLRYQKQCHNLPLGWIDHVAILHSFVHVTKCVLIENDAQNLSNPFFFSRNLAHNMWFFAPWNRNLRFVEKRINITSVSQRLIEVLIAIFEQASAWVFLFLSLRTNLSTTGQKLRFTSLNNSFGTD